MKTKKKFDCVKMTRDIRDKIYKEQKNMSDDEILAYYSRKAVDARKVQETLAVYGKKKAERSVLTVQRRLKTKQSVKKRSFI